MNSSPEQNEKRAVTPEKPAAVSTVASIWTSLRQIFLRNLLWKLLAVVLALSLWAGLITQDPTLTREKIFTDVPITTQGTETLRRNGFILLSGAEAVTIRLRADVPQREYNTVAAVNYNPRIDLTRISETGTQNLRIATTSTSTYGTVQEVSPDSIEVIVDAYTTKYRVPVSLERTGQYPTGFQGTAPSLDPSSVMISGPKSIVDQIARVVVDFDVSTLPAQEKNILTAVPMRFVDLNNEPVESDLIEVSNAGVLLRSIVVEQPLYPTKTLPIHSLTLTSGQPATGYEIKSITATPSLLVAAGDPTGLSLLDSLFLEKAVDVTDKTESFSVEVSIRQPSELVYLSTRTIMLTIEIEPVISTREFHQLKLSFLSKGQKHTVQTDLKTVSVILTGPQLALQALKAATLTAYVDTSGLDPGEHEAPIMLDIADVDNQLFTYSIMPKTVLFQISP